MIACTAKTIIVSSANSIFYRTTNSLRDVRENVILSRVAMLIFLGHWCIYYNIYLFLTSKQTCRPKFTFIGIFPYTSGYFRPIRLDTCTVFGFRADEKRRYPRTEKSIVGIFRPSKLRRSFEICPAITHSGR